MSTVPVTMQDLELEHADWPRPGKPSLLVPAPFVR